MRIFTCRYFVHTVKEIILIMLIILKNNNRDLALLK